MMYAMSDLRIVDIKNEDDGTTGGKKVYIDNRGNRWVKSMYTKADAPTGIIIAHLDEIGRIIY